MAPVKTGKIQAGRFSKGKSGNPDGRPKGSRNKITPAIEALLDDEGEALTQKAIDLAKTGDMQALRLCLDRLVPPRKDRPVSFELPAITCAGDAAKASAALVAAVAIGQITPSEERGPAGDRDCPRHAENTSLTAPCCTVTKRPWPNWNCIDRTISQALLNNGLPH